MNTITLLRVELLTVLAVAAGIMAVHETGLAEAGALPSNGIMAYWMQIAGVALTLILVPFALKLLSLKGVRNTLKQRGRRAYRRWSEVRLAMLTTPLMLNIGLYYGLGYNTTCGYLALMVVVPFFFIWPSQSRMEDEMNAE